MLFQLFIKNSLQASLQIILKVYQINR